MEPFFHWAGSSNSMPVFTNIDLQGDGTCVFREFLNSENSGSGNSFIGGGASNCIDSSTASSYRNFIGGGDFNIICQNTSNSSILGGSTNSVYGNFSAVLGGGGNCVSGCYSAVLGGQGNTVSHNYAAAFGCGISSVCGCAFHANNFVAQNIPLGGPGTPGSFYKVACLGGYVVMVS